MKHYETSLTDHLRKWLRGFDLPQIAALLFLLGVGVVFIHSTGQQIGTESAAATYLKQLRWIAIGGVGFLFFAHFDYRKLLVPSFFLYLFSLILLILVFLIGVKVYGAQRWLNLPGLGMRLQPSEVAKVALVMVLSALFTSRLFSIAPEEEIRRKRRSQTLGLAMALGLALIPFLLIVRQPDLGSALVLLPICASIIFVAGIRWKVLSWGLLAIFLVIFLGVANEFWPHTQVNPETGQKETVYDGVLPLLRTYQRERLLTFLDPERDLANRGYNSYQARLAIGSGGMTGKGIGEGTQNLLGFLPHSVSNNDFIFSVIAEETGFLGGLALMAGYLLLFYSIIRTAIVAGDPFGRCIAVGFGTLFFIHVYINIGMSIGLAPITGLPLPFVSYGGSFLFIGLCSMGILQSIYRYRLDFEE